MHRRPAPLVIILAVLSLLAGSALADDKKKNPKDDPDSIGDRQVGTGVNFYSLEKEIALGKQLAQEVERQAKIIDDPTIAEYINRVGQNIVRNSDAKVPFTIKVLDTEEVNAFALPGGFFYVNSGLILAADEEAELAGVMAHEMSHVMLRHGTAQATKATPFEVGSIAGQILGAIIGGPTGAELMASEALHLLAAGAWLGGLLPLFLAVRMLPHEGAASACRGFTPIGLAAVLLLAGTAVVQVVELMGGLAGLFGTSLQILSTCP